MVSFTGSPEVGIEIKKKAGMKKSPLSLGTILHLLSTKMLT